MKDHYPSIDYSVLVKAQKYYEKKGYLMLDVPWAVSEEADAATHPVWLPMIPTMWGNLVGSAEQSFIDLMIKGKMPTGKRMAITPCFRPEKKYDQFHYPYFMKLELIEFRGGEFCQPEEVLQAMIHDAVGFLGHHLQVETRDMGDGSFDIVSRGEKLELGSYGIRQYKDFKWVYGTGVAEPRFSQARRLQNG